jgi:hypothetical protein
MAEQVPDAILAAKQRLERDVAAPGLSSLLAAYYNPGGGFAGAIFDTLGSNPRNEVTRDDLLAVTLLGVRLRPPAVRRLLGRDSRTVTDLLVQVTSRTDLWEASDQRLAAIGPLWALVTSRPDGLGDAAASKLLARKRPRLVPITDRIIVSAVGARGQTRAALRYCLQDPTLRQAVEALRPQGAGTASVLRLLGVALWMLHSQSNAARTAREAAGATPQP